MSDTNQMLEALLSHKKVEWYTPLEILNPVKKLFNHKIDLDPASNQWANDNLVGAREFYTIETNGLGHNWFGNVFLNPPYSKTGNKSNQEIWAKYLIYQYQSKSVTQAILLTKSVPGYRWYEETWDAADGVCLVRELVCFINPDNPDVRKPAKHGTTLFYFGPNKTAFKKHFEPIGRII